MTIFVDYRRGSAELVTPLTRLGLPAEKTTLEFGDLAWQGRGNQGAEVDIGVEFKKLPELAQSLRSGRLAGHQLLGLRQAYTHCWLVIEGLWKQDAVGTVMVKSRYGRWKPMQPRMTATELEKQLLTLQLRGGISVRWVSRRSDTLRFLTALYRWWTDVNLDQHTSHLAIYHPAPLMPISKFRKIISSIDDVGFKVSLAAEHQFKTVRRAINASPAEWAALTTTDNHGKARRLGERVAANINRILTSEER